MDKKEKKQTVQTLILLVIIVGICITASVFTFNKKNEKTNKEVISNLEESLLKKMKTLVGEKSWLTGEGVTEEFTYILTLRELKEKYQIDIQEFEEAEKCNLEETYIIVKANNGKATYTPILDCKRVKTEK